MNRLPIFVALAALIAASPAALAQGVTTNTSSVDSIKVTGARGAANKPGLADAIESKSTLANKLHGAHSLMPTVIPPQSDDSHS